MLSFNFFWDKLYGKDPKKCAEAFHRYCYDQYIIHWAYEHDVTLSELEKLDNKPESFNSFMRSSSFYQNGQYINKLVGALEFEFYRREVNGKCKFQKGDIVSTRVGYTSFEGTVVDYSVIADMSLVKNDRGCKYWIENCNLQLVARCK